MHRLHWRSHHAIGGLVHEPTAKRMFETSGDIWVEKVVPRELPKYLVKKYIRGPKSEARLYTGFLNFAKSYAMKVQCDTSKCETGTDQNRILRTSFENFCSRFY